MGHVFLCRRSYSSTLKCFLILILFLCLALVYGLYSYVLQNEGIHAITADINFMSTCDFVKPEDDISVMDLLRPVNISCHAWQSFVYFNKSGFLHINSTAVRDANFNERHLIWEYSIIDTSEFDHVKLSKPLPLIMPKYISEEFIHVTCTNSKGVIVYSNFHFNLNTRRSKRNLSNETNEQLSLIIVGFDSVSRFVAEKKLPKTLDFVENKLDGYAFKKYSRVGDNTLPNLLAAFTGRKLIDTILSPKEVPSFYRELLKRGYIDCYSDDWAPWPVYFLVNYPKYTHFLHSIVGSPNTVKNYQRKSGTLEQIYLTRNALCFGNEFSHNIVLQYGKQCIERYINKRKYVFIWNNILSHSSPNPVSLADDDTVNFLRWMNSSGHLDNAVLVLMSDHGSRYGAFAQHYFGRITGNIPLLSLYIPRHMKKSFPHIHKNLKINTRRLTSHFDLHETLKDIIFRNFQKTDIPSGGTIFQRGISLFQEIPENRTCYDASIVESYCPCYRRENVSTTTESVREVSDFAVMNINEKISKVKFPCKKHNIVSIKSAEIQYIPSSPTEYKEKAKRHVVVFKTGPGFGIFQALVDYKSSQDMTLIGNIDRLNAYGNQSTCVTGKYAHADLLKFCYCY